jgi:hypothetical protein
VDVKAFMLGTDIEGGDSDTPKARLISRLNQRNSGERTMRGLETRALAGSSDHQIGKTWWEERSQPSKRFVCEAFVVCEAGALGRRERKMTSEVIIEGGSREGGR